MENIKTIAKLYVLWVAATSISLVLFLPSIFEFGLENSLVQIVGGWAKGLVPPPMNFVLDLDTGPEFFVMQLVVFTLLIYWFFLRRKGEGLGLGMGGA